MLVPREGRLFVNWSSDTFTMRTWWKALFLWLIEQRNLCPLSAGSYCICSLLCLCTQRHYANTTCWRLGGDSCKTESVFSNNNTSVIIDSRSCSIFHVLCLNCLFLILSAYLCCHKGLRQSSPTWGCLVFVLIQAQGGCDDESVSTGGCKQRAKHSNADISHVSEKHIQRKACSHELARAVSLNQEIMLQI